MSRMESMDSPKTRAEFERKFFTLTEALRNGKLFFSRQVESTTESLLAVRTLPNKRIDFLSVDESARLTANMIAQPRHLDEDFPDTEVVEEEGHYSKPA